MMYIDKKMSKRMQMVAQSVKPCKSVFDTGSDHAFIPIYLIQKGICQRAAASDIRKGPLRVSLKNIQKYELNEKISISIGDGMENADGFECVIIAGMGGRLIKEILERKPGIAKCAEQIVMQPMNAPEKLRKYLWDNGYSIYFENLCSEKHKVYNVICARHTGERYIYKDYELHSSAYLVREKNQLLQKYLIPKLKRLNAMAEGMEHPGDDILELIKKLEEMKNANILST